MTEETREDDDAEATRFAERFRGNVMRGLWAVLTGDTRRYREARREFEATFPDASPQELARAEAETPEHLRWWAAEARDASADEADELCHQCEGPLGNQPVKRCPGCGVVLHASCYDNSMGGYQTPGCRACELRCYTR